MKKKIIIVILVVVGLVALYFLFRKKASTTPDIKVNGQKPSKDGITYGQPGFPGAIVTADDGVTYILDKINPDGTVDKSFRISA